MGDLLLGSHHVTGALISSLRSPSNRSQAFKATWPPAACHPAARPRTARPSAARPRAARRSAGRPRACPRAARRSAGAAKSSSLPPYVPGFLPPAAAEEGGDPLLLTLGQGQAAPSPMAAWLLLSIFSPNICRIWLSLAAG